MKSFLLILLASVTSLVAQVSFVRSEQTPEFFFYPGEAKIRVSVAAPADSTVSLVYDLLQAGGQEGGVAATLLSNQPAAEKLPMDGATVRDTDVLIQIPEVKRPTKMILRLHIAEPHVSCLPFMDSAHLHIFPQPAPEEWRDALATAEKLAGRRLAVFGESPHLRAFFKTHRIGFEDLGEEYPASFRADFLTIGEITAESFDNRRPAPTQGVQLLFLKDSTDFPGVYQTQGLSGSLVKITLPIITDLEGNPSHQASLMKLLLANLTPPTP